MRTFPLRSSLPLPLKLELARELEPEWRGDGGGCIRAAPSSNRGAWLSRGVSGAV
jgi:hypothetical protein